MSKKVYFIAITLLFNISICSAVSKKISMKELSKIVSKRNYKVLRNAELVYQSKEKIKFAQNNLLPKLNLWNILKLPLVFIDPLSVGDVVQDVAPFLVPSNWFAVKQNELMSRVQNEQYTAVWGNQLSTARQLFLSSIKNNILRNLLLEKVASYKEVLELAEARTVFSNFNIITVGKVKDLLLEIKEDLFKIDNLNSNELNELKFILGMKSQDSISLEKPELPDLFKEMKIDPELISQKTIDASPESRQFKFLKTAVKYVKKSIRFNILGASSFSAEGNGYLGSIPIQDGLGFGNKNSIAISNSELRKIENFEDETNEVLRKQAYVFSNEYNNLIDLYSIANERSLISLNNYEAIRGHIYLGGKVNIDELVSSIERMYLSKIQVLAYQLRFSQVKDKIKRLTFSSDYGNYPNQYFGGIHEL